MCTEQQKTVQKIIERKMLHMLERVENVHGWKESEREMARTV